MKMSSYRERRGRTEKRKKVNLKERERGRERGE